MAGTNMYWPVVGSLTNWRPTGGKGICIGSTVARKTKRRGIIIASHDWWAVSGAFEEGYLLGYCQEPIMAGADDGAERKMLFPSCCPWIISTNVDPRCRELCKSFMVPLDDPVAEFNPGSGCILCLATAIPTGICPAAVGRGRRNLLQKLKTCRERLFSYLYNETRVPPWPSWRHPLCLLLRHHRCWSPYCWRVCPACVSNHHCGSSGTWVLFLYWRNSCHCYRWTMSGTMGRVQLRIAPFWLGNALGCGSGQVFSWLRPRSLVSFDYSQWHWHSSSSTTLTWERSHCFCLLLLMDPLSTDRHFPDYPKFLCYFRIA